MSPQSATAATSARVPDPAVRPAGFALGSGGVKEQLRRRAQADFSAARGNAHLQLLRTASDTLARQIDAAELTIKQRKLDLQEQRRLRHTALRQTLVRQLVEAELPTLPGIGPRLATLILREVFRGELDDLRQASSLEGIGPQKQATINAWIDQQKRLLPGLLEGDFPGKAAILAQYEPIIEQAAAELAADEAAQRERKALRERVAAECYQLGTITAADYEQALLTPGQTPEKLHHFQLGVFAPWEPPPDWFLAALEAAGLPDSTGAAHTSARRPSGPAVGRSGPKGVDRDEWADWAAPPLATTPVGQTLADRAAATPPADDLGHHIIIRD